MTLRFVSVIILSLLIASCGSSKKGPAQIVSPPVTPAPPTGGPNPPTVPGIGNNGKLSMHVEEGGHVTTSPSIGTCAGRADCEFTVARGTVVTMTAIPDSGWEFEEWDNCSGPSGTQCVETIEALTYVKAEFDPAP